MIQEKTIHDYTKRGWGHDYVIHTILNNGQQLHISGWGHGITQGDYILFKSDSKNPLANKDTRYEVNKIIYHSDPNDMWSMEATFAPR